MENNSAQSTSTVRAGHHWGAAKLGYMWTLLKSTPKPVDGRAKAARQKSMPQRGHMVQMEETKCISKMSTQREPLLMKSKLRVQKHGEVFTPQWVVDKMVSIPGIREKAEDVFATFLEPSAGEGAFLLTIENAKLRFVIEKYGKGLWNTYALWALTSIYGIEFLEDNLRVAQQNMLSLFADYHEFVYGNPLSEETDLYKSARTIILANVIQGNTLTRKNLRGEEITFSQWSQVPKTVRKVERTTFAYSSLFADEEDDYVQDNLLDMLMPPTRVSPSKYAVVDIEQVWREEKENG